jgi:Lrp/AsnC family leucine-responsive transcriptional regulator
VHGVPPQPIEKNYANKREIGFTICSAFHLYEQDPFAKGRKMFDAADKRILAILQAEGNVSNQELSNRTALSPPACWRRVRALEAQGVIKQYVALLEPEKIGLKLLAFAFVDLENHHVNTVGEFDRLITSRPEILECHMLSGSHDYLLRIIIPDMQAYEAFLRLHLLPNRAVRSVNSSFSMAGNKITTALPIDSGVSPTGKRSTPKKTSRSRD